MPEDIKATLWKSADKLRAQMDAAEYKHIVLGLIFLKYISDTFVKQQEKVKSMVSDPSSEIFVSEDPSDYAQELEERDYYTQDNVFWVPQEARWETLRSKAKQPDIGSLVDDAMTAIENLSCIREPEAEWIRMGTWHYQERLIRRSLRN